MKRHRRDDLGCNVVPGHTVGRFRNPDEPAVILANDHVIAMPGCFTAPFDYRLIAARRYLPLLFEPAEEEQAVLFDLFCNMRCRNVLLKIMSKMRAGSCRSISRMRG